MASRRGRWAGQIALAVSVLIVAAVTVTALGLLGRRGPAPHHAAARPGTVAAIVQRMAVLRRPQTPADRAFPLHTGRFLDRHLLRLATTAVIGQTRVRVFVKVSRPGSVAGPRNGAEVEAIAAGPHGRWVAAGSGSGPGIISLFSPSAVRSGWQTAYGLDQNVGVSIGIVPDGVARVRWVFSGLGVGVAHPQRVTVSPKVANNVAIAPVIPGEGPLASATWYGSHGQIIASSGGGALAAWQRKIIRTIDATRARPIDPFLVSHFRLFRSIAPDNPAHDWRIAQDVLGGQDGVAPNYWQVRYIGQLTGLDGRGLWIVPGTHGVCIDDPQAGSCGPITPRQQRSVIIGDSTSNGPMTTISGLAPDGNRTVTILLTNGSRRRIPVIDNVFEATITGRPAAILARNAAGHPSRLQLG